MSKVAWKTEPDDHDYPAAAAYLSLIAARTSSTGWWPSLRSAEIIHQKAKDILRASRLRAARRRQPARPVRPEEDPQGPASSHPCCWSAATCAPTAGCRSPTATTGCARATTSTRTPTSRAGWPRSARPSMTFATLALIAALGMLGPLLALPGGGTCRSCSESCSAGVVVRADRARRLHAARPDLHLLADIGFALVMFVAGTHVPVRDPSMRTALRLGALRAVAVGVVAVPLAVWSSRTAFGTGHTALYAVLMASSSAALILPIVDSLWLERPDDRRAAAAGRRRRRGVHRRAAAGDRARARRPRGARRTRGHRLCGGGVPAAALCRGQRRPRPGPRRLRGALVRPRAAGQPRRSCSRWPRSRRTPMSRSCWPASAWGSPWPAVGEPRRLARQLFAHHRGLLRARCSSSGSAPRSTCATSATTRRTSCSGVVLGAARSWSTWRCGCTRQPVAVGGLASAQLGVPVAAAALGHPARAAQAG